MKKYYTLLILSLAIGACSDKEEKEPTKEELEKRKVILEKQSLSFFSTFDSLPRGSCADPSTMEVSVLKSSKPIFIRNDGTGKLYAQVRLYLNTKNGSYTIHYTEYFRLPENEEQKSDFFKKITGQFKIASSTMRLENNANIYSANGDTSIAYVAKTSYSAPEFSGSSFILNPGFTNINEDGKLLSDTCK